MRKGKSNKLAAAIAAGIIIFSVLGCTAAADRQVQAAGTGTELSGVAASSAAAASNEAPSNTDSSSAASAAVGAEDTSALIDTDGLFSDRDLQQEADLSGTVHYTVEDGTDIHITEEGVYVLTGSAEEVTVYIEAADEAKVQLVLDGLSITNKDFPCIYVVNADKVFVTTTDSENHLTVTDDFAADGDTNTDAVIFSKDDLVLNGTGTLTIESSDNGITSKDDLKVTGGTYEVTAASKAFEANDSIVIADGTFDITAGKDAFHAENDDDDSFGYMWIGGGTFVIEADDDGIQANAFLQIDGGTFDITAVEGIESTNIQINDGSFTISASDDGINAAAKSTAYSVNIEINGGEIEITMGQGDTDGFDSNGNLTINGGTIRVSGNSAFDYDGKASLNGGTVYVNGTQVTALSNQMMGGLGGMRGMGSRPGMMQGNGNIPENSGEMAPSEDMPALPEDMPAQEDMPAPPEGMPARGEDMPFQGNGMPGQGNGMPARGNGMPNDRTGGPGR